MDIKHTSIEGIRKGGMISQLRRRLRPEYYRNLGCNLPKLFNRPKFDIRFAELIGILLGDGGITETQINVTLNSIADKDYIIYVENLIKKLFAVQVSRYYRKGENSVRLVVSGTNIVRFLSSIGMKTGNKVKQQVDVPYWIKENCSLSEYCLRGLVDTDGCIFLRKDSQGNKKYTYRNLYFSNLSQPLRIFVHQTLINLGYNAKLYGNNHVRLYSDKETSRYLKEVGSSNFRILRWKNFPL